MTITLAIAVVFFWVDETAYTAGSGGAPRQELEVSEGVEHRLVVSVYGSDNEWDDRLMVRRVDGDHPEEVFTREGYRISVLLFEHQGRQFLHLTKSLSAATRTWEKHEVLWIAPDSTLHAIEVDRSSKCGPFLPAVGPGHPAEREIEANQTGEFDFRGEELSFTTTLPHPEHPWYGLGPQVTGTLVMRGSPDFDAEADAYRPTFVLAVETCEEE